MVVVFLRIVVDLCLWYQLLERWQHLDAHARAVGCIADARGLQLEGLVQPAAQDGGRVGTLGGGGGNGGTGAHAPKLPKLRGGGVSVTVGVHGADVGGVHHPRGDGWRVCCQTRHVPVSSNGGRCVATFNGVVVCHWKRLEKQIVWL